MSTPTLDDEDIELLFRAAPPPAAPAQRSTSVVASFRFAGAGLRYFFLTQRNARIHLAIAGVITLLAFWLDVGSLELAVLWLTMALVLVTEAMNTAIEATVDLVTETYHPLARIAKDTAAGAVLLAAVGAVLVGLAILAPPLIGRLAQVFLLV